MNTPWFVRQPLWLRLAAAAAPLALGAVLWLLQGESAQSSSLLAFVLLVVAAAATGDRAAGVITAISSTVWFDFFFTEPYLSLTIRNQDDVELAVLFVVVGLAVTEIALWGRRQHAVLTRQAEYLDGAAAVSQAAMDGPETQGLTELVCRELVRVLNVDSCTYAAGPAAAGWATVRPDGSVVLGGRDLDAAGSGLPTQSIIAIPVQRRGAAVGHFRLVASSRVSRPTVQQLQLAVLFAQLVGRTDESAGPEPVGGPD